MNEPQRFELLRIARTAILSELARNPDPVATRMQFQAGSGGAFVTVRNGGQLRGCMGTLTPKDSVVATVEYAARAVCNDPRFTKKPVTAEEMTQIKLEVSLLSEMQRTDAPESLVIGEHGILIRRGDATGCFLPQVAVDQNWSAEEFLSECCVTKAKLPRNSWNEPDTQVYLFSAEVIEESERQ